MFIFSNNILKMSNIGNGNKFKGNKQKKASRARKSAVVGLDESVDQYAVVDRLMGGNHIEVKTLKDDKPVMVSIPGRFYKRVWFNKGDVVIISKIIDNLFEIKGKVAENELLKLKSQFDKLDKSNGDTRCLVRFGDEDDSDDDDDDQKDTKEEKSHKPIPKDRAKNQHKGQARVFTNPDELAKQNGSNDEFNIDDI